MPDTPCSAAAPTGGAASLAMQVRQVDGSGLSSTIAALGAAGYVVTAAATNTAGYTLIAVHEAP